MLKKQNNEFTYSTPFTKKVSDKYYKKKNGTQKVEKKSLKSEFIIIKPPQYHIILNCENKDSKKELCFLL